MDTGDETLELLRRWHGGDRDALDELIERDLPWIREQVRRRVGPLLRDRGDCDDYVQDAMIEVLQYGPRFVSTSKARFRSLLARIIENVLRDRHDWYRAKRRSLSKERPLPSDSCLNLDPRARSVTRPSQAAQRTERESWVRLALEFLDPEDRKVILLRQWDELSFPEIAQQMGLTADSARMRFQRALPKLGKKIAELRSQLVEADADPGDEDEPSE